MTFACDDRYYVLTAVSTHDKRFSILDWESNSWSPGYEASVKLASLLIVGIPMCMFSVIFRHVFFYIAEQYGYVLTKTFNCLSLLNVFTAA